MIELNDILDEYDHAWRSGEIPRVDEFLNRRQLSSDQFKEMLKELIAIDLEYRWRNSSSYDTATNFQTDPKSRTISSEIPFCPLVEDYLSRWSEELAGFEDQLPLISEEFRVRHRWGDAPSIESYVERFEHRDEIESRLEFVRQELISDSVEEADEVEESVEVLFGPEGTEVDLQPLAATNPHFGRYQLIKMLGAGGMGDVWLAIDPQLDRKVALKRPRVNQKTEEGLARFVNEAKAAANLRHPGICPVYDAGEINGQPFLTMAYIEGNTLQELWKQEITRSAADIALLLSKVASAMQAAHTAGVVHRDLKPSNIMIDVTGEPVIMDFGLAFRQSDESEGRITKSGETFGSPSYMSPEQVEGSVQNAGAATDIYTLGVILFEACTGELPFKGSVTSLMAQIARDTPPKPSDIRQEVDTELESLCLQMLSKDAEQRPESMEEVARRLMEIHRRLSDATSGKRVGLINIDTEPQFSSQNSSSTRLGSKKSKRTGLLFAALLLGVGLFGVTIYVRGDQGTVVVEAAPGFEDQVSVTVLRDGVPAINGWQISAGENRRKIRTGRIEISLPDGLDDEFLVEPITDELTVRRGGKVAFRISRKPEEFAGASELIWPTEQSYDFDFAAETFDAKTHRRIAEWVIRRGGNVTVSTFSGGISSNIKDVKGLPQVDFRVVGTQFYNCDLTSDDLKKLILLKKLQQLVIEQSTLSADHLSVIAQFKSLQGIALGVGTRIEISDENLATLVRGLPALKSLRLIDFPVTGSFLAEYSQRARLTKVELITKDLKPFLPELDVGIGKTLSQSNPFLTLNLDGYPLSPELIKGLKQIRGLRHLSVNDTTGLSGHLSSLSSLPALEKIDATNAGLSDADVDDLRNFKSLLQLNISGNAISKAGIQRLQDALPNCDIIAGQPYVTGCFLVQWEESTGKTGDSEYEFHEDGTVLKEGKPRGRLEYVDGDLVLDFDEDERGTVRLSDVTESSFKGFHQWGDEQKTSTWIATIIGEKSDSDWISLFNGTDLTGWQPMLTYGGGYEIHRLSSEGWEVRDGTLVCSTDQHGFLQHEGTYGDFDLRLEFKLADNSNSGLHFRTRMRGNIVKEGLEAQIIDDDYRSPQDPGFKVSSTTRTGAIYAVTGPKSSALRPLGEWNEMQIRCEGDHVEVFVNGIQTATVDTSQKPALKDRPKTGKILISNWAGEAKGVAFRNILLRKLELPDINSVSVPSQPNPPRENHALYFDGVDDHVVTPIKFDGSHPITIETWVAPVHPWRDSWIILNSPGVNGIRMILSGNGRNQPTWSSDIHRESFKPDPIHHNTSPVESVRTHLAYVWDGVESRFFINGEPSEKNPKVRLLEFPESNEVFRFGMPPSKKVTWMRLHGYMDEIRFSNIARYTSNFDPPERHEADGDTIALYHCDEMDSGLVLRDASGNGNHADIFGATRKPSYEMHVPGPYYRNAEDYARSIIKEMPERTGPALRFTTSGAKVTIPAVKYDFSEPFTAEFWGTPFSEWQSRYEWGRIGFRLGKTSIRLSFPEDRWRLRLWDESGVNSEVWRTQTVRFNHRMHFAMQWNGEHCELFINGQPAPGPEICDGGSFGDLQKWVTDVLRKANDQPMYLGSWEGDAQFGGEIDSFRLSIGTRYQQADDPEEVPVSFEPQELEADEQTLILYDFHEGEGDVLHDLSGNDYHGEITSAAIWVPAPPEIKPLPGLIAEPQAEEGVLRSQIITRWPRSEPCHHSFSPDGKLYAVCSLNGYVRIFADGPEGELKSVVHVREQRRLRPFGIHWSSDSSKFVSWSDDWVQVWSVDGKLLHEWQVRLSSIGWHPTKDLIYGAGRSRAYLWNIHGEEVFSVPTWGDSRWARMVWSPDGSRFITTNGKVGLMWDQAGKVLNELPFNTHVYNIFWSPDGSRLALTTTGREIQFWTPEGSFIGSDRFESSDRQEFLWSPDSQKFLNANRDFVTTWSKEGEKLTRYQSQQFKAIGKGVTFSPDSQEILILKYTTPIEIHDADTGERTKQILGDTPRLTSVDWNPNRELLVVADHTYKYPFGIFNRNGMLQTDFPALAKGGYSVVWNSVTDEVILGADWSLMVARLSQSAPARLSPAKILDSVKHGYRLVDVHPEGTMIAGTGMNNPVKIVNSKGELVHTINPEGQVEAMQFSPDGRWLAINVRLSKVVIYDTATWKKQVEIEENNLSGVAWNSTSSKIATMISCGPVKIFDLQGELLQQFEPDWRIGRDQSYNAIAWSPDDQWITTTRDIDVQAYHLETRQRKQFPYHVDVVRDAVWISPTEFVTAAHDGTMRCYSVESGSCQWTSLITGFRSNNLKVANFSNTGEIIATSEGVESSLCEIVERSPSQFIIKSITRREEDKN